MTRDPEKLRRWREANAAKLREQSRAATARRRAANPEAVAAEQKRYYDANRDARLAATQRWREANPEQVRAYRAAYEAAHPRPTKPRRPSRMPPPRERHLIDRHGMTAAGWADLWEAQDGCCYLCEMPLPVSARRVHIDHDHRHCPPGRSCSACRRGLAHVGCNTLIGLVNDDPGKLLVIAENLIAALEGYDERVAQHGQGSLF
jgi:hypothetical protein